MLLHLAIHLHLAKIWNIMGYMLLQQLVSRTTLLQKLSGDSLDMHYNMCPSLYASDTDGCSKDSMKQVKLSLDYGLFLLH